MQSAAVVERHTPPRTMLAVYVIALYKATFTYLLVTYLLTSVRKISGFVAIHAEVHLRYASLVLLS